MKKPQGSLAVVLHWIQHHFIWLLIASYAIAALCPTFGLWIRSTTLLRFSHHHHKTAVSLPMLMLGFLLLNAGLGVNTEQLRNLFRKPLVLLSGLIGNLLVPIAFIWCAAGLLRQWHDPEEVQVVILGLGLVAAMPIAGSSTAWSQNANGDMALSLALMLLSTFFSPLTTPFTFGMLEHLAFEEYALALIQLGSQGTGLLLWVIVPVALGIFGRWFFGAKKIEAVKPALKALNYVNLLLLNYSNASVSLPQAVANPDWDFMVMVLGLVTCLCLVTFAAGWFLAHIFHLEHGQRVALMFGLGMNNNGTGLVLASLVLADFPRAMLPLIFYNLVQHLVAGGVDYFLSRGLALPERLWLRAKA